MELACWRPAWAKGLLTRLVTYLKLSAKSVLLIVVMYSIWEVFVYYYLNSLFYWDYN